MKPTERSKIRVNKFIDEYFKSDCRPTEAMRKLGVAGASARTAASRYMKDEYVQQEIARRREKIEDACDVSEQKWINFVWGIAKNPAEKTSDRLVAGDMIAKKCGYYKQKIDVTSNNETMVSAVLVLPEIGDIRNAQVG